jgi:hypothetical protein
LNIEIKRLAEALIEYDVTGDCENRPSVKEEFNSEREVVDEAIKRIIHWRDMIEARDD